jgi:hypothetical protein
LFRAWTGQCQRIKNKKIEASQVVSTSLGKRGGLLILVCELFINDEDEANVWHDVKEIRKESLIES